MLVRYWEPFREFETLRRRIDQVFEDLGTMPTEDQAAWAPAIELKDTGDNLTLRAQLPGIDPKDLDIQVTREGVAIAGEYKAEEKHEDHGVFRSEFRYGSFKRVVPLPVAIEHEAVEADYNDGVLTLTMPKAEEVRNKVFKVNLEPKAIASEKAES